MKLQQTKLFDDQKEKKMKFKFAHLADCHLGAWRNEILNQIGFEAFKKAIDKIIEEKVNFVIISGDLYDVSNPRISIVDLSVKELKRLKDNNIPVYGIMGSHDFSPSNRTMIRPLISADLYTDVSKGEIIDNGKLRLMFTEDPRTRIKITGLRARKRSLEIEDYKTLDRDNLEKEKGAKIFVLHTLLSELKPKEYRDMESAPKSLLPPNFDYYAGGHLHKTVPEILRESEEPLNINDKNNIVYPGSLYPTDFRELEKYQYGGFCIISGDLDNDSEISNLKAHFISIQIKEICSVLIDCNNKTVKEALDYIVKSISHLDVNGKIVTVRIIGTLASGKAYEIKPNEIKQLIMDKGAIEVLINKNALVSKEYSSKRVVVGKTNKQIEDVLIHEHAQQTRIKKISKDIMENKIHEILEVLGIEREEGQKVKEYNEDLLQKFLAIFDIADEEDKT
ncbi:MAG: exonuclease SbcCD subunit D [Candidatus Hodarchaeota archaeon]